ncbi:nitrilase-related carbon-nitrogen hydrolase [Acerihabitans sp. KWT182]|uniref:Nitrilase-related carbon-nitrogen hydrolase n=1 Tax=Acerihabitans sp. KWT182 TaxID=3157919 RepID=A0AAU7Q5U4_9GAMM
MSMSFRSLYQHGFARVAACTLSCALAEPAKNVRAIVETAVRLDAEGVALGIFPELCLSGYSIEDLLLQDTLLDAVERAVDELLDATAALAPVLVVGAPLRYAGRIYNTALVLHRGRLLGVAPKSYLPTYREFYERRQCAAGDQTKGTIRLARQDVPFGPDLLFEAEDVPGFVLHAEICEDFWVPIPPAPKPRWPAPPSWRICQAVPSPSVGRIRANSYAAPNPCAAWPLTSMPRRGQANPPPKWPGTANALSMKTAN